MMEALAGKDRSMEEAQESLLALDFKMVTFSLGGKDYGIDIMQVKEITKISSITYVPNTSGYVRGVYNLRGEIIPVIDLRKLFFLPIENRKEGSEEEVIILRLPDDLRIGVIVDRINKVMAVSSQSIQPPHPLFADINLRYIQGVVESEGSLYIILDVSRVFQQPETRPEAGPASAAAGPGVEPAGGAAVAAGGEGLSLAFLADSLKSFCGFHVSELNRVWVQERFRDWEKRCKQEGRAAQLRNLEDAQEFLKPFYSQFSDCLWGEDYRDHFLKLLPDEIKGTVNVWDVGCGRGFEAYSLAAILTIKYPGKRIRIWANDNNLISISTAPNLTFDRKEMPSYLLAAKLVKEGPKGMQFVEAIRESIMFEYHDVLHQNEYPDLALVVARDVLSFFEETAQERLLEEIRRMLRNDGSVILGQHEEMRTAGWRRLEEGELRIFRKEET